MRRPRPPGSFCRRRRPRRSPRPFRRRTLCRRRRSTLHPFHSLTPRPCRRLTGSGSTSVCRAHAAALRGASASCSGWQQPPRALDGAGRDAGSGLAGPRRHLPARLVPRPRGAARCCGGRSAEAGRSGPSAGPEPAAQAPSEPATPAQAQEPAATPTPAPAPTASPSRPPPLSKPGEHRQRRRSTGTGHRTRAAASGAASGSASGRASPAHFSARRPGRPGSCYRTPGDALRSRQCRARHAPAPRGAAAQRGLWYARDISASWKRLEYLLDQAEGAIKRQDLAAARRNLNLAERETDKLEQFLGR